MNATKPKPTATNDPAYEDAVRRTKRSWVQMRRRCNSPQYASYHRYGGRGIGYDPRWDTFAEFLADMGLRPEGTSLDRIDGEKGYLPSNCRWASPEQQQSNMVRKIPHAPFSPAARYGVVGEAE